MTSVITRKMYSSSLDEKMTDDDKCNNYADIITDVDGTLELNVISEGSSGSSIAEMNNNTNGKVLNMGPHVNINDNRQQMTEAPKVQAPTVQGPDCATVMKKIKQIYMDEVPLHLSGLSLSGSGMELFVKLDENLDKALRQAKTAATARRGKKRKRLTKAKKLDYLHIVNKVVDNPCNKKQDVNVPLEGLGQGLPKTDGKIQVRQHTICDQRKKNNRNDERMGDLDVTKDVDAVATQSKPSVTERIRQLKVTPRNQQSFFPYGHNQNYQQQTTPMTNLQCGTIRGPIWNIENGQIDVMRSIDTLPSTSNVQATMDTTNTPDDDDAPIDYSLNPFPGGFKSNNLPLKRRISPPRWQLRNAEYCTDDYDSLYQADNSCSNKEFARKERIRRVQDGKIRKLRLKKAAARVANAARIAMPSTSQEAAIKAAERAYLPNEDVKQTSSDVSHGEQSSVGPHFQTDLLTPQTMDADTLIKFTEYTHDLRKDLKQKYKDLSKLLKAFEDTVQKKNSVMDGEEEGEENTESDAQVGRCRIM